MLVHSLHFKDKSAGMTFDATAIESLTIAGPRASVTGRGTVNGTPGVTFFVELEDLGKAGADTFRIVLGNGYAASGALTKGNITVAGGLLGFAGGAGG